MSTVFIVVVVVLLLLLLLLLLLQYLPTSIGFTRHVTTTPMY